jgi:hypothetical protein
MTIKVPPAVRVALYVLTLLGAPVVVYLRARGVIGDLELTLWGAEVTAVSALAAFNVPTESSPAPDPVVAAVRRAVKKAAPKPPAGLS